MCWSGNRGFQLKWLLLLLWGGLPGQAWAGLPENDLLTRVTSLVAGQLLAGTTLGAGTADSLPVAAAATTCDDRNLPDVWCYYSAPYGVCMPTPSLVLRIRSATLLLVRLGELQLSGGPEGEPNQMAFKLTTCGVVDPAAGFLELKLGPMYDKGTGIGLSSIISVSSLAQGGSFTIEVAYDSPAPPCAYPNFRINWTQSVRRGHSRGHRTAFYSLKRVTV